jgi:putative ABC transport system substrate-binding protein
MRVTGFLSVSNASADELTSFRLGLRETGHIEGGNLAIEYHWAEGRYGRLRGLADDLVSRKVEMLVTVCGHFAALAAKNATSTIPIVFLIGVDPVVFGLTSSFARPGGNLTGVSMQLDELTPKRLQLSSELIPQARLIALLVNPNNVTSAGQIMQQTQDASTTKGLHLEILKAGSEAEIDAAFENLVRLHAGALLVSPDAFFDSQRERIVSLAARYSVPAIYHVRDFVVTGGLMSYGPNFADMYRRVRVYAGKILNGAKPADLPIEQPTKFELVVNLKTAKALGLTVPASILARADEVIE